MAKIDGSHVASRIKEFGRSRYSAVDSIAREGEPDGIGPVLLLAIAYQESHIKNIVGDHGHGRGFVQIDDRSHQTFLRGSAGCKSGSWNFTKGKRALDPGYVPGLTRATAYAISLLRGNMSYGKQQGVKKDHLLRFAIASYNCGAGNAIRAYRRYGIDGIDRYTAHGDYSKRVLETVPHVKKTVDSLGWR